MHIASGPPACSPRASDSTGIVSWVHIGDLHMMEAGEQNYRDLQAIVAQLNTAFRDTTSFVFLPGDNADNGSMQAYAAVREVLDGLALPWCAIVGDHDVHERSHRNFLASLSPALHYSFTVGALRFLALNAFDIPEPPSFAMLPPQLAWVRQQLTDAHAAAQGTVLLLHGYPGDLQQGREKLQALIHEYRPLVVDTGHTHYNEVANNGHTLYTATRSTGQIEEGPVGFSVTAVDGPVVSWRFFPLGQNPCVLITSPADARLSIATEAATHIRAKIWSSEPVAAVTASIDQASAVPMRRIPDSNIWECELPAASRTVTASATTHSGAFATDTIQRTLTQRTDQHALPSNPVFHEDRFTVGAWPEHGLLGTQLGPNKNGRKW